MKNFIFTVVLLLAIQLNAQTHTATVTVENGQFIRNSPSVEAQQIGVVPYKGKVNILESPKEFDQIALGQRQVVGEWKKISFKHLEGYIFDKFLSYDTDYRHENYRHDRQCIDIYTEKQFFDNIGDGRTLNIKAKRLNLAQYGKDNFYTLPKYCFNKGKVNGKGIEATEFLGEFSGLMLIRVFDLEIRSEAKSTLILGSFQIENSEGITFNNLRFLDDKANDISNSIELSDCEQIYFTNIDFEKGSFYANPNSDTHFKYCDFDHFLLRLHDSHVHVDECKFYNAEKEIIDIVPTFENLYTTTFKISNSFIGYNMNMVNVVEIEKFMDDPMSNLNFSFDESNIIKYNPKYESVHILVPFKP